MGLGLGFGFGRADETGLGLVIAESGGSEVTADTAEITGSAGSSTISGTTGTVGISGTAGSSVVPNVGNVSGGGLHKSGSRLLGGLVSRNVDIGSVEKEVKAELELELELGAHGCGLDKKGANVGAVGKLECD